MEEKYLLYNQMMNTNYEISMMMSIIYICFLVALTIFVLYLRMPRFLIGVGIVAIIFLLHVSLDVYPLKKDANEYTYSTYEGEFFVESYFGTKTGKAFILIQTPEDDQSIRYRVLCEKLDVEDNQTYRGYFVYGQNSKCIVELFVEEDIDP